MNLLHQQILVEIKKAPKTKLRHHDSTYYGSPRASYGLSNPVTQLLTKKWVQKNKDLAFPDFLELLDSLFTGNSQEERGVAGRLLQHYPKLRAQIEPLHLDIWLDSLEGWGEIDGLCQSNFEVQEFLSSWEKWEKLIVSLAYATNINKRRASLVLLTGVVRHSDDSRFSKLAFKNIDKLKTERAILITKAVSWLLRDLIKNHRQEVEKYLLKNQDSLPKIAIRETQNKLKTGKK